MGVSKGLVLLAAPEGWRLSVLTVEGGMLCGHLADVPPDAGPAEARAAAAAMLMELARDVNAQHVDVMWDPPREPGSWAAQVTVAATPPSTCG
ncbi:hypothetical protein [Streptomyces sp. NPDC048361]|uniref:hypothetical protein n=1 Tax=Streptomyces sp. NPDC048361 TaxID=3154720 RepID=UPI00341A0EE1